MLMSKLRWLLPTALMLALVPAMAAAQETGVVSGRVLSAEDGSPLSGAQVEVQGTVRRAVTNQQGRYEITGVPVGRQAINVSLIGRAAGNRTVTVAAGGTVTADFTLAASALQLEGIVVNAVTGRVEKKRELGTNTASIQVAEIAKGPITKFADVLTGRTAGVNLQGVSGTTGTSQKLRIRGANSLSLSNEPLIYVDGVLFSNSKGLSVGVGGQDVSRLNDLNSEDIDNVEVLKGPAASALYGTAAANGVVLITTKRGRAGSTVYRVYAEGGRLEQKTSFPANFFTAQVNEPNADLFTAAGRVNRPAVTPCSNVEVATISSTTGQPLCRQDRTISFNPLEDSRISPFDTGDRTKFGFSASGGSEAVTFFLSGDKENETGVIDFNTLDKINLRANLTANLNDKWNAQVTTGYVNSDVALNANDNNIFSPLINGLLGLPLFLDPAIDAAERPRGRPSFGFGFNIDDIREIITFQEVDRFTLGLNTNYRPLTWLSANANVGLDYFSRTDSRTLQPGRLPIAATFTPGQRFALNADNYTYTANTSGVATFELSPSIISTSTLGASYNRELFESVSCFGVGIVEGTRSCSATSSQFSVDEGFSEVITVGGFFQQQFAFRDRIFLAGSLRGDNNSAFGSDFGFIYYPGASLSWVVSEEPFFPTSGFLSNLRVRTALGSSGLRPNFRNAVTLFGPVSVTTDAGDVSGVTLSATGNPDLEPERTTEFETGLDAGLFNDRVSVEFTYFNKRSQDALISRRLPPSFGLTGSVFDNLGQIRNWGTELGLDARVIEADRVRFNMRLSATILDNEIEELGRGVEPIVFNRGTQRHQEGFPPGAFFARPFTFNDANNDGKLSIDEVSFDATRFTVVRRTDLQGNVITDTIPEVFVGRSLPTNTQAITANLTLFKYLTLTSLFERRAGMQQVNDTESFRCAIGFGRRNSSGQGGCNALFNPDASLDEQARFIADRFLGTPAGYIEDADFVKWREASVALGIPPTISRRLPVLEGATLTFAGRNLRTWTDYTGLDPEINESGGSSNFTQGEFNTQPPVRYFTARLDLTF